MVRGTSAISAGRPWSRDRSTAPYRDAQPPKPQRWWPSSTPSCCKNRKRPLRAGSPQRFRDAHDRDIAARGPPQRMAQQRRRASVGARRRLDIVAVENQPAAFFDGLIERPIDAIAADLAFDQRKGAQIVQVHGAAVDAGKNAAR